MTECQLCGGFHKTFLAWIMSHHCGPKQECTRYCYSIAEYVTPNDNTGYYSNAQTVIIDGLQEERSQLELRVKQLKQKMIVLNEIHRELSLMLQSLQADSINTDD